MEAIYHRQVLRRAIGARVSPRALGAVIKGNLGQDSPSGLLRPEFHFDDSLFARGQKYIEDSRTVAARALSAAKAWAAFGRLSHAAQDFYSHSNYVTLWRARFERRAVPPPEAIDGLDPSLLKHPRLVSGHFYLPFEALWLLPPLRSLLRKLLPRDSHAWMNLDSPAAGPLFPYSIEAAIQRTIAEFDRTLAAIGEESGEAAAIAFCDM